MRLSLLGLAGLLLIGCSAPPPPPAAGNDDYLTKEGNLTAKLVVTDGPSGLVDLPGRRFTVEPSGSWTSKIVKGKGEKGENRSGTLSKEGLANLAKELARYKLRSLDDAGNRESPTPHNITITFGDRTATLTMLTGATVPMPDATTPEGRFGGIVRAVAAAVESPGEK